MPPSQPPSGSASGISLAFGGVDRLAEDEVVDGDVSNYFDAIPHADLVKSLARRLSDRKMLRLLKRWLKAPVAEPTAGGGWRFSGGKRATRGTPQGGVVSPLLALV